MPKPGFIVPLYLDVRVQLIPGFFPLMALTFVMPLNIVMPRSYGLALPVELGTLDRCGRGRVLQIIPEAKRRQYKQVLDAYEAAQNEENPEPKPAPKP